MAVHAKRIGIFTATRWELNAIRRAFAVEEERSIHGTRCVIGRRRDCRLYLFQTGIGELAAGNAVERAMSAQQFDLMVSTGFACALASSAIGDLLIGTEVARYDQGQVGFPVGQGFRCSPELVALAMQVARSAGPEAHAGRFVTVPRVLSRAAEKREVAERTGAIGTDMESWAICAAAESQQIPMLITRAVSDVLEEDLPLDFNQFLRPGGWIRGMANCLTHPRSLGGLNRMRLQGKIGADRLTGFFVKFLDELG